MVKRRKAIYDLTLSALFTAIGIVLPFMTGQIPQIGKMLLPMHIPVFLCGLICGWQYGLCVGEALPLMRSLMFGMPPLYPNAVAMAFELAVYGFVSGFLYSRQRRKPILSLYASLVAAMLAGRAIWAGSEVLLLEIGGKHFTFAMFVAGAFTTALPGIVFQLVFIPAVMIALDKTGIVRFKRENKEKNAITEKERKPGESNE